MLFSTKQSSLYLFKLTHNFHFKLDWTKKPSKIELKIVIVNNIQLNQ